MRAVSSSRSKLGSEENGNEEMGQRKTIEAIGSDFRDSLLLLFLMQQLTIVWETVLGGSEWGYFDNTKHLFFWLYDIKQLILTLILKNSL